MNIVSFLYFVFDSMSYYLMEIRFKKFFFSINTLIIFLF